MTEQQKDYIDSQLHIIQRKNSTDELNRYYSMLDGANIEAHVKAPLVKACDIRRREIDRSSAMVELGDLSDVEV